MRARLLAALGSLVGVIPVPIFEVADAAGWVVRFVDGLQPEALGLAVSAPPIVLALLDSALAPIQQRYVLAHEMGHVLAEHRGVLALCSERNDLLTDLELWMTRREEREADLYAARLLIPDAVVLAAECEIGIALECAVPSWMVRLRVKDMAGEIGSSYMRSARWSTVSLAG